MSETIKFAEGLSNIHQEKIEELKKLLPNLFDKDGNLIKSELENFTSAYATEKSEPFVFSWAGKQKAKGLAFKQSEIKLSLKFDEKRSKDFNKTENLVIEGDNLHALKLLLPSYKGKVKCIYIDPPYNTQNDFIYPDNFAESEKEYLLNSGQIDIEGNLIINDRLETNGRKHSVWLSMIYPRLVLARELLREDGVIFVSIDDNEVHNLRQLMNEVFGDGFFGCLTWISRTKPKNMGDAQLKLQHNAEYILAYGKNSMTEYLGFNLEINAEKKYDKNDELGNYRLEEVAQRRNIGSLRRDTMVYEILGINPKEGYRWQLSQTEYGKLLETKKIINLNNRIFTKIYKQDEGNFQMKPFYTHLENIEETAESAKKDLSKLMNVENIFDTVKPVNLVKQLIFHSTSPNDLILDFFAGSGTTAQAVMELNQEEIEKKSKNGLLTDQEKEVGGRKFILVQAGRGCEKIGGKIDEKKEAFKAGYRYIFDITIERIRRAAEKYKSVDNGFKVMTVTESAIERKLMNTITASKEEILPKLRFAMAMV